VVMVVEEPGVDIGVAERGLDGGDVHGGILVLSGGRTGRQMRIAENTEEVLVCFGLAWVSGRGALGELD
jgi:hypothetical protein